MSRIPRVLHYTFGMAADFGGKPWSLVHYVCLKSAIAHIHPEQVYFYYEYEPTGPWWALTHDLVTLVQITTPREIFGTPLAHVAHRSDVVRLQKLIEHGGIYLDADVLVQRDFDDLLDESVVLGREGEIGMANAVILAEPNAPFLVRWLDAYRSFRSKGKDEFWSEHSVLLPAKLAQAYPQDVTILPAELRRSPVVVDLGCGDFEVSSALLSRLPDITYVGCDIVPELIAHNNQNYGTDRISFRQVDIVVDPLPAGDICLVRQVLQHLSNEEISNIMRRLGRYRLIYVTEGHPEQRIGPVNPDKAAGADVRFDWKSGRGRGVELDRAPFNATVVEVFRTFAPPHEVIITQQVIPNATVEA